MKTAFLSSTAKDLAEYRNAAYKAIEGLDDWHCVRMEDFGARDAMADEFCQGKVAECDVFVGIVGHCYGSSPKGSEKSYTEQEYDAAVATGKPRLMFLAPEDFPLPAYLIEPNERWAKQRAFRDRVNAERIRDTFTSPENLAWRLVQATRNWEQEYVGPTPATTVEESDYLRWVKELMMAREQVARFWTMQKELEERLARERTEAEKRVKALQTQLERLWQELPGGIQASAKVPEIFLCYSKAARKQIHQLYDDLQRAGFKPWMDEKDILPGEDWELTIRQAIRRTDFISSLLVYKLEY